jgi:hypothetical protein
MIDWKRTHPTFTHLALAIWWGGLTFYAACVVPIGTDILGAEMQGMVTQRVTHWLNAAGWLAMTLMAIQMKLICRPSRTVVVSWATTVITLIALQVIHSQLDGLLAQDAYDDAEFYSIHRWYLLTTTVQWLSGLVLIWQTTRADESTE